MPRSSSLERKLEQRAVRMQTYGRLRGALLAAFVLGACSLSSPASNAPDGSSAGAAGAAGSAPAVAGSGQSQPATAGAKAMAGTGQGGGAGKAAIAAAGAAMGGDEGTAGDASVGDANGVDCSNNSECASNFCVDGVCCDTSCGATCSSCRETDTGMANGVCGFVRSGQDSGTDCNESTDACGRDGTCDGAGACRFKGVDAVCGDQSCTAGKYSPAAHCDGAGTCAAPTPISCGSYPCQGTLCAVTCSASVPCPDGLWCDAGSCQAKKTVGAGCNIAAECTSSACVEGVCCDGACTGTCRSCRAANTGKSEGVCSSITAGTDPANECTAAAASSCGNDGACDGAGACRRYANTTVCRSKSCSDGANSSSESGEVKCNGGACGNASSKGCGDYKCNGSSCRTSCTQSSHCVSGKYCDGNSCVNAKGTGSLCKAPAECTTGICGGYQTNVSYGHCCSTPSCSCPGPSFTNLLKNPGFDRDYANWSVYDYGARTGLYGWYQFEERDSCSYSGMFERQPDPDNSGYQVILRQCVPVQAGTTYNFGGSWKSTRMPEGQGSPDAEAWSGSCMMAFYATTAICEDYDNESQNRFDGYKTYDLSSNTTATYQWFAFNQALKAPQSAQAAVIECSTSDDYAPSVHLYFDKFYVTPTPGKF